MFHCWSLKVFQWLLGPLLKSDMVSSQSLALPKTMPVFSTHLSHLTRIQCKFTDLTTELYYSQVFCEILVLERVGRDGPFTTGVEDEAMPTAGTVGLESLCCYIRICNIALPICLQSLQTNREYRGQLKINNKRGELYAEYLQIQYRVSSGGNPGLKDGAESRDEETTVNIFAQPKHFTTTTSACSPKLD